MSQRALGFVATVAATIVLLLPPVAAAQQPQLQIASPAKDASLCEEIRPPRGKPRLTALPARVIEPKRTPEGWPDLQGNWSSGAYPGAAVDSVETGWDPADIFITCKDLATNSGEIANLLTDPMRGQIPYQPWAKAKQMEMLAAMYAPAKRMDLDTDVRCFPRGVPRATLFGSFEFRYMPGYILISYPSGEHYTWRIVPMDGRPHLNENVQLFMGDSTGRWEGNTLVVETTNHREGAWLDKHATFYSPATRVVERWTLVDQNTMYYEVTIEDAKVFRQPWKMSMTFDRTKPNTETREVTCHEGGERFVQAMVRSGQRARAAGLKGYHIHVDVETGKAVRPEEQKYLEESGQLLGHSYAPPVPDDMVPPATAPPSRQD
jgi:hypothetical protein